MTYRIDAALTPAYTEPDHLGINVHDFFVPDVLHDTFGTVEQANEAALRAYLGETTDNNDNPVAVTWQIVKT